MFKPKCVKLNSTQPIQTTAMKQRYLHILKTFSSTIWIIGTFSLFRLCTRAFLFFFSFFLHWWPNNYTSRINRLYILSAFPCIGVENWSNYFLTLILAPLKFLPVWLKQFCLVGNVASYLCVQQTPATQDKAGMDGWSETNKTESYFQF